VGRESRNIHRLAMPRHLIAQVARFQRREKESHGLSTSLQKEGGMPSSYGIVIKIVKEGKKVELKKPRNHAMGASAQLSLNDHRLHRFSTPFTSWCTTDTGSSLQDVRPQTTPYVVQCMHFLRRGITKTQSDRGRTWQVGWSD
jgi:hypothetical protein